MPDASYFICERMLTRVGSSAAGGSSTMVVSRGRSSGHRTGAAGGESRHHIERSSATSTRASVLLKTGAVRVPDVLHGRSGLLLCRLHPSSRLSKAAQSCKRAIRLANHRQVLAQDAVGGVVNDLVAATGLFDEPRKRPWLKSCQVEAGPYGLHARRRRAQSLGVRSVWQASPVWPLA
jgi:hypothetical protein